MNCLDLSTESDSESVPSVSDFKLSLCVSSRLIRALSHMPARAYGVLVAMAGGHGCVTAQAER